VRQNIQDLQNNRQILLPKLRLQKPEVKAKAIKQSNQACFRQKEG
jgi:hypothetical protein